MCYETIKIKKHIEKAESMATYRIKQVSHIEFFLPVSEESFNVFLTALSYNGAKHVKTDEFGDVLYENMELSDAMNIMATTFKFCEVKKIDFKRLSTVLGVINSYKNLHKINFKFINDDSNLQKFDEVLTSEKEDKSDILASIYSIKEVELNLNDIFYRDGINYINRMLAMNYMIPNDYLGREYSISIPIKEYLDYFKMTLHNIHSSILGGLQFEDKESFSEKKKNFKKFMEIMLMFPDVIVHSGCNVKIITSYDEV